VSQADLARYLSGEPAWSEVEVSRASAMGVTAVYACVRLIAESVASLPLILYRRLEGGGKERATDHPLYPVLHNAPNREQNAFTFKEQIIGHLLLNGNTYSEISRKDATVLELWPLDPEDMRVKRVANEKVYVYRHAGTEKVYPRQNILHVPGMGYDGITGYSPIELERQAIGLAIATEKYGAKFFANDGRPGGVIQHPGKLKDDAAYKRMRDSWEAAHRDWENKHRVAILEEGATFKEISLSPEHAQFLETRKFQVAEIARIFRVPPHMIGDVERSTSWGTGIEQQQIGFVVHTLRPWLVRIEQAVSQQLLMPSEREEYFAEFLVDALLRGDLQSRAAAYRTFREIGIYNANEIREMENKNPVDGGEVYFIPMNWIPADKAEDMADSQIGENVQQGKPAEPVAESEPVDEPIEDDSRELRTLRTAAARQRIVKGHMGLFRDATARVLAKERRDVVAGAKEYLGTRELGDFKDWLERYYKEFPGYIRRAVTPIYRSVAEQVKAEIAEEISGIPDLTPEDEEFLSSVVFGFVQRYIGQSKADISSAIEKSINEGMDALPFIEARFDYWDGHRPARVANRESVQSGNAFAKAAYVAAGVLFLRWVTMGPKTCPFCQRMNGMRVKTDATFALPGDVITTDAGSMGLSRTVGHPPLHDGCVCQIVAG
jgi:HK97 family phage portal protein